MVTRPTIMEVDISAFNHNINEIRKYSKNKELMPVIKANAYGTYINKYLPAIKDFNIVAVATVDEAVELRELGFKNDIFVLNQPYQNEIEKVILNNITIGISSKEFLYELLKHNKKVKVHLEIETGMGRTGIKKEELKDYIEILLHKNIDVEGIYTHLSSADYDKDYTISQLEKFKESVKIATTLLKNIKYIHALASTGIINYLNDDTNLIRPGIIIYGYDPYKITNPKLSLKPVCKLKSKITFLKEVEENTSISYSRTYTTTSKTKIATIPIGYADGIRRSLSNKGEVVIDNKRCKIIGNICMDSLMVDVTDIDVKVGDDVYIWDNENITIEEIANITGTINYEILSTISSRVPRIFINTK